MINTLIIIKRAQRHEKEFTLYALNAINDNRDDKSLNKYLYGITAWRRKVVTVIETNKLT